MSFSLSFYRNRSSTFTVKNSLTQIYLFSRFWRCPLSRPTIGTRYRKHHDFFQSNKILIIQAKRWLEVFVLTSIWSIVKNFFYIVQKFFLRPKSPVVISFLLMETSFWVCLQWSLRGYTKRILIWCLWYLLASTLNFLCNEWIVPLGTSLKDLVSPWNKSLYPVFVVRTQVPLFYSMKSQFILVDFTYIATQFWQRNFVSRSKRIDYPKRRMTLKS